MPDDDDATLSEFVPDEPGEDEAAATGGTGLDDDPAEDAGSTDETDPTGSADDAENDPTDAPVDPAVSTADHRPGGAPCDACGATVQRRWRDDGALVCADCKDW